MIPYEMNESREYRQRRGKSEARLQKSGAFNKEDGYRLDAKVSFLSTRSKFLISHVGEKPDGKPIKMPAFAGMTIYITAKVSPES
jgi:hypothetical protein